MMMAILDPKTHRRRRRFGLASLIGSILLVLGGGWAAAGGRSDYVLVVVDARTGEEVGRTAPAVTQALPRDAGRTLDRMLRTAAADLADRLDAYAAEAPTEEVIAAPSTVFGSQLRGGPGLRIELMDMWAMPGAPPLPEVEVEG